MTPHWETRRRKVVVVMSLISTLLLLATVLQGRQQSEQTLEQQVSFSVPLLNISISLGPTHPSDSSDLNNRTQEPGPSTGEEQWSSGNSTTIRWDSREQDSAANDAQGELAVFEPSFQAPVAFDTRSTHIKYPQEARQIRIAINTQPRQSPPVYAYDIGNAYDTGQEPDFFAGGQDSSSPPPPPPSPQPQPLEPLLPSHPPPPQPSQAKDWLHGLVSAFEADIQEATDFIDPQPSDPGTGQGPASAATPPAPPPSPPPPPPPPSSPYDDWVRARNSPLMPTPQSPTAAQQDFAWETAKRVVEKAKRKEMAWPTAEKDTKNDIASAWHSAPAVAPAPESPSPSATSSSQGGAHPLRLPPPVCVCACV